MRLAKMIAAAALLAFAVPASANTITFETAPPGPGFTGPVTEAGFTYQLVLGGGALYVNGLGNPGQDMEGQESDNGGILVITRQGGGAFTFDSLDFSAYDGTGLGTQDLLVIGARFATGPVGTDTFTLANTANVFGTYDNWTTEHPLILAGVPIEALGILLNAGTNPDIYSENIDNIVLSPIPSGVPEPATLALFGAGLLGFAARRRRNKA